MFKQALTEQNALFLRLYHVVCKKVYCYTGHVRCAKVDRHDIDI